MRILLFERPEAAAECVAAEIVAALARKPDLGLGLPVGGTPLLLYERLARMHRDGAADFSRARVVVVDEYLGLDPDDPRSHRRRLIDAIAEPIGVAEDRLIAPPTRGDDLDAACARFEKGLGEAGGIDLQVLGVGTNGHIGFNEPGGSLRSRTRVVTLMKQSLRDATPPHGEEPPEVATTLGIGTLLEARRILLLAFGERKAEIVHEAVEGPVTAMCPASALQLHPDVTFVLDAGAASLLSHRVYYRRAQHNLEALSRGELPGRRARG